MTHQLDAFQVTAAWQALQEDIPADLSSTVGFFPHVCKNHNSYGANHFTLQALRFIFEMACQSGYYVQAKGGKNPTERLFMGKAFRLGFYLSSCAKLAGDLYNYSAFTNKINVQQVCTWPPSHPWILWRTEQKDASFISQWNHSPKQKYFEVKSLCAATDCSPLFHFKRQTEFTLQEPKRTGQHPSDLCSHTGIRMQDPQEWHQHLRCGHRDRRRAIMDVVKHKTLLSDQETLFFRLKYNQINVSKTNYKKKSYYILKLYFPLL